MSQYPSSRLDKAVQKAADRENAAFLADPQAQQEAAAQGETWERWINAEQAVGDSAVVLPVALAQDLLLILNGGQPHLRPGLVQAMLADHVARASRRA